MRKHARLMFAACALTLVVLALAVTPAFAQEGGGCEFQTPMADGRSVTDHIVAGGDLDTKFPGLHKVGDEDWPGVDTQGEVRPIFREGGRVKFSGWDSAGGGWGIILDGEKSCEGWRMAVWHFSADLSKSFPIGSWVNGSAVLGFHGHSGNLREEVWDHNHISVGFRSDANPFGDFGDGTTVKRVQSYWWIHPARVEVLGFVPAFQLEPPWGLKEYAPYLAVLGAVALFLIWIGPLQGAGFWLVLGAAGWAINKFLMALLFGFRQSTKRAWRFGIVAALLLQACWISLAIFANTGGDLRGVQVGLEWRPLFNYLFRLHGGMEGFYAPKVLSWRAQIERWAAENGLDPDLLATVMSLESCGWPDAVSPSGAQGLFQVMPYHFVEGERMQDPEKNAFRGAQYLKAALAAYDGDVRRALAAYNGGIGGTAGPEDTWSEETQTYAYWGARIYQDARRGLSVSPAYTEWLRSRGRALCQGLIGR